MAEIAFFNEHQVFDDGRVGVSVGFSSDTRGEGIILDCVAGEVSVPRSQPRLEMYPDREQRYMKQAITIVYRLTAGNNHKA